MSHISDRNRISESYFISDDAMKTRFSTLDICASLQEINKYLVGHYVVNIYDIDNKTYLIKLRTQNAKKVYNTKS